jgi:hypothetical protein
MIMGDSNAYFKDVCLLVVDRLLIALKEGLA